MLIISCIDKRIEAHQYHWNFFSHCTDVRVEAGEDDKILCVCLHHLEDDGKDDDEDDDNDGDGNYDDMVVILMIIALACSTSIIKSNLQYRVHKSIWLQLSTLALTLKISFFIRGTMKKLS